MSVRKWLNDRAKLIYDGKIETPHEGKNTMSQIRAIHDLFDALGEKHPELFEGITTATKKK